MKPDQIIQRFVYKTQGVCPPEIHFQIQADFLREVRFVGGGCPGNAYLVSRLLKDKPLREVRAAIGGVACRNDTSCADQLARALAAVENGDLAPAGSFHVLFDPHHHDRIGLIGDLNGRPDVLEALIEAMRGRALDGVCCMGNLTGDSARNKELLGLLRKEGIWAIQGEQDWLYAQGRQREDLTPLKQKEKDFLLGLPQVISFTIGSRQGIAFFGEYVQTLSGYSDYEPFALEMNMVCSLTRFMQDETVFPALEAMIPQFKGQIIAFSQIRKWGHWQLAGTDFISVGPALADGTLTWGLLESGCGKVSFKIIEEN